MRATATLSLVTLLAGVGLASWFFLRPSRSSTYVDTSRESIIKEMRQLGRLETASFTIEKIIEAGKDDSSPWRNLLFGDKLLLIANGEVIAGYDLSALADGDVEKMSKTLRIKLPAPQILSARLDNEKTRVYDRNQGILSRGDKDLETEARLAAEQSIREAACAAGILGQAQENAVKQLKALFGSLGYTDIIILSPSGSC